jgi:hypothetical protein
MTQEKLAEKAGEGLVDEGIGAKMSHGKHSDAGNTVGSNG